MRVSPPGVGGIVARPHICKRGLGKQTIDPLNKKNTNVAAFCFYTRETPLWGATQNCSTCSTPEPLYEQTPTVWSCNHRACPPSSALNAPRRNRHAV